MSKPGRLTDRLVVIGAAVAAPVLTTLVDLHVIAANIATDLGAVVAAGVAAYHGGQVVGRRKQRADNEPGNV